MTSLLKQAFEKASRLPSGSQNILAKELLEDIDSELKWDGALISSQETLETLAKEALREYKAGKTKKSGFDKL